MTTTMLERIMIRGLREQLPAMSEPIQKYGSFTDVEKSAFKEVIIKV